MSRPKIGRRSKQATRYTWRSLAPCLACSLFAWGLAACTSAAPATGPAKATEPAADHSPQRYSSQMHDDDLAAFDEVWTTIRDRHWDPTLGGLDWNAVRAELRPRVEQATSRAQVRAVIEEMIGRLGQSHFALLPSSVAQALAAPDRATASTSRQNASQLPAPPPGDGETGFDVRVVGGHALVTQVDEGSPAWEAGVRPGWILLQASAVDVDPLIRELSDADEQIIGAHYHLVRALQEQLQGAVGAKLHTMFRDGEGRLVKLAILLRQPEGRLEGFGNLPPTWVALRSRWVQQPSQDGAGGIGVIALNVFLDPVHVMDEFGAAVRQFQHADGIILDLRGNPGGIGGMAMGMAGWFIARKDQFLGIMITRDTRLRFVVNPRPQVYTGRLAVLVDDMSASTAEILAAGLSDLGRARVFGQRSAGMALPSLLVRLPNGDAFQYAFANYETAKGTVLEGAGVTPDVSTPLTRAALLAQGDPALHAAQAWIDSTSRAGER